VTACGWLAGINTISPAGTVNRVPAIVMSASPSRTCATASNGAVCSLNDWPSSNANSVSSGAARDVELLLEYPEQTVGRLMTTNFASERAAGSR